MESEEEEEEVEVERLVLADIPGLVEGAHRGIGLGFRFLRHVERTRILIYLLDMDPEARVDPLRAYSVLREEMKGFDPGLLHRPGIVCLNKMDLSEARSRLPEVLEVFSRQGVRPIPISAKTGEGLEGLRAALFRMARDIVRRRDQG
jgi:GTP-binding protein